MKSSIKRVNEIILNLSENLFNEILKQISFWIVLKSPNNIISELTIHQWNDLVNSGALVQELLQWNHQSNELFNLTHNQLCQMQNDSKCNFQSLKVVNVIKKYF
jgi:hypothetical protein